MTITELEMATRDQVNARRNYLMGLWAGQKLGFKDGRLTDYVHEVMESDYEEPGPQDVVRKVRGDLTATGIDVSEADVLLQLQKTETSVRSELLSTD